MNRAAPQPRRSTPYAERRRIFWRDFWAAADASRAYRRAADVWRAAGSVDYADQLDHTADTHDAEWDARMRAAYERRQI